MPTLKTTAEQATIAPAATGSDATGQIANDAPSPTEEVSPLPTETLPENGKTSSPSAKDTPPLPEEEPPPLPDEVPPGPTAEDDGWAPVWDATANAYYFYNRFTQASQWDNPRVPDSNTHTHMATDHDRLADSEYAPGTEPPASMKRPAAGGYNPAIHGDYDPNADYAVLAQQEEEEQASNPYLLAPPGLAGEGSDEAYGQQASFNRFTGRFTNTAVHPTHTPDQHTDEAKSKRQMNAFFDVDAAANAHGGKSLRAERQGRKLSKKELQEFQQKRRAKKEDRRRAWLKD